MSRAAHGVRPVLLREFRIQFQGTLGHRGGRVSKNQIDVEERDLDEEVEVEPVEAAADEEITPLDAAEDAEADFYAAQAEEVEEPADLEFSADSLQLFLKDVGKVD